MKKARSNGEGSIFRRKDGRWVAEIQAGRDPKTGKPKRHAVYAPADAKESVIVARLDELRARLRREGRLRAPVATVREFFEQWLEQRAKVVSEGTLDQDARAWRMRIAPTLGGRLLANLTVDDIQRWQRQLEADGVGPRSRLQAHTTLSVALGDAVRWEMMLANPAALVDRPAYRAPEKRALTAAEARELAKACDGARLGAAIVLALYTGMRQSEIFGLRWSDVDFGRNTVAVRRKVANVSKPTIGPTKNASSQRSVYLAPPAVEALQAHRKRMLAEPHGSAHVFVDTDGGLLRRSNFIRRVFHPARDRAGLPGDVTFHTTRHTTATLLLEAGVHPKVVGDMLGFASTSILLDTYSHAVNPQLQKTAADALEKALGAPAKADKGSRRRRA